MVLTPDPTYKHCSHVRKPTKLPATNNYKAPSKDQDFRTVLSKSIYVQQASQIRTFFFMDEKSKLHKGRNK